MKIKTFLLLLPLLLLGCGKSLSVPQARQVQIHFKQIIPVNQQQIRLKSTTIKTNMMVSIIM